MDRCRSVVPLAMFYCFLGNMDFDKNGDSGVLTKIGRIGIKENMDNADKMYRFDFPRKQQTWRRQLSKSATNKVLLEMSSQR